MSKQRFELLAAIRAQPGDDSRRLAFADWVEKQGERNFAQLIRLELERDKLPKRDPRRQWYKEQLSQPRKLMPADCYPTGIYTQTHRGLPWFAETGVFDLQSGIDKLGPYAPTLFVLMGGDRAKEQQAEQDFARGGPDLVGEALCEIGRSEWLRQWDELQIYSLRLTEDRVRSLAGAGSLTQLLGVTFRDGADDGAVRAIAESRLPKLQLFGLQEVMLWDQSLLTPDAVLTLLHASWLDQLKGLILCGAWLEERALKALASSSGLAGLRSLDLRPSVSSWAGEGMRALLHSPYLAGLKLLNIALTELDPEIAALLARPDVLPGLETLVVTHADKKFRDLLKPRFGKGLYFGAIEGDDEFDEKDGE
jgi:uncharacterized protein (TIGR02996 family)